MDMMELIKWLPDNQKDRLLELEKTFSTPGWQYIMQWARDKSDDSILRAATATSWADNRIAIGNQQAYFQFANYAEAELLVYANMAEQAKLDAEVEESEDYE